MRLTRDKLGMAALAAALLVGLSLGGAGTPSAQIQQDNSETDDSDRSGDPLPRSSFDPFGGDDDGNSETDRRTINPEAVGGDVSAGGQTERRNIPRALGSPMLQSNADGGGGSSTENLVPYGSQLFTNRTPLDRTLGVNPDYEIKPGDRIAVRMWGAVTLNQVLNVDQQGNIFLPEIGPIRLEGVKNRNLDEEVRSAVRRVYTQDVEIYTNLLGTQPIGVYVTGAVNAPGSYPGERTDTILYYLARAGGVSESRGSYRRIEIKRDGQVIATADLYDFLLDGDLPRVAFEDGDTIVVRQRESAVRVAGNVQNAYRFELESDTVRGARIMELSAPEPRASYALVRGLRNGRDFSTYLPVSEFSNFTVHDGDRVVFNSDNPSQEILVNVVGNSGGPSSFTLPKGARLKTLAQLVQVDPEVAKLDAMYLRRDSVAARQKQAIERALYNLQKTVLTTPSVSTSESQIRSEEARLVRQFVQQARALEPEGRVVLANAESWRDVRLEDGDDLVIPNQTDVVLISGEVEVPQTVIYNDDFDVRDYVAEAGGLTSRGDAGNVIVVQANGRVHTGERPIQPGDHLMVLPGEASKLFAVAKDIVEVVFRSALSTATVINASRR